MKKQILVVSLIICCLVLAQSVFAGGDIEFKLVDNYYKPADDPNSAQQNLDTAVDPILDMFGFLTGGGLYNTADVHGFLGFDAGVKLTAMQVSDDNLGFSPDIPSDLRQGPLADESIVPLPVLHVGVGLLGNLEVMGRAFSYPMGKEGSAEGNITLIGLGIKYGLLQTFGLPKVAVVGAYHYLDTPEDYDFGSVNNLSAALIASYSLPLFLSFYGGLGIDYTRLKIEFPDDIPLPDPEPYTKQNFRGLLGVKVTPIPFLFINFDYNFGAVQGFSAGAGISIR